MKKSLTGIVLLVALWGIGCDKRTIESYDLEIRQQQRYFPMSIGHTVVYKVDSVVFDVISGVGQVRDSSTTFIREVVLDTLRDNTGALVWTIERSERPDETAPWQVSRIWSAVVTDAYASRTEENLRFMRLVFPMDKRSAWNGNLWIDANREIQVEGESIAPFANWNYEVDSIDIPRKVGSFQLDSTLVITEVDEANIIEKRFSKNIYAKNIGLVYKEQWIMDSQYCNQNPVPADCETKPWFEKAEKGYYLRQVLWAY